MRASEILKESVTFSPVKLKKFDDGREYWTSDDFETEDPNGEACWVCDGTGVDPRSSADRQVACDYCNGKKILPSIIKNYTELNVANANAAAIADMLGYPEDTYGGIIPLEKLPEIRRKLIKLKNGDISNLTQEPTMDQGGMRRYTNDNGMTAIGRGPKMYDFGRSHSQVTHYIDTLLTLIDFCQKNGAALGWA